MPVMLWGTGTAQAFFLPPPLPGDDLPQLPPSPPLLYDDIGGQSFENFLLHTDVTSPLQPAFGNLLDRHQVFEPEIRRYAQPHVMPALKAEVRNLPWRSPEILGRRGVRVTMHDPSQLGVYNNIVAPSLNAFAGELASWANGGIPINTLENEFNPISPGDLNIYPNAHRLSNRYRLGFWFRTGTEVSLGASNGIADLAAAGRGHMLTFGPSSNALPVARLSLVDETTQRGMQDGLKLSLNWITDGDPLGGNTGNGKDTGQLQETTLDLDWGQWYEVLFDIEFNEGLDRTDPRAVKPNDVVTVTVRDAAEDLVGVMFGHTNEVFHQITGWGVNETESYSRAANSFSVVGVPATSYVAGSPGLRTADSLAWIDTEFTGEFVIPTAPAVIAGALGFMLILFRRRNF